MTDTVKSEITKFIENLFKSLERHNIKYCILRNAEEVEHGDAHDVDMTIDEHCLEQAEKLFLTESKRMGWSLHLKTGDAKDKINIKCYHFYYAIDGQIVIAHIDIFPTFSWDGYELIDNAHLIENINSTNIYHRAASEVEAVTKLFIRLLHNGYIKSKYKEAVKAIFKDKPQKTKELMKCFLDADAAEFVANCVFNSQWTELEKKRDIIIASIKRTAKKHKLIHSAYLIKKALGKSGVMIAFEGTDGSGKSTIIDGIKPVLSNSFPEGMLDYYHWRPGVIKKEKKSEDGAAIVVTEPHAKKPYGRVKSFAKFMFFNLDYLLGYWVKVRWQLSKGHLVVFDRYYYDYYMDKIRYRLNITDWVLNAFRFMIPKPDITFLLIGDPEILYERKKEISKAEIQQQIDRLIQNKRAFNNSVVIDVNQPINRVVYDVAEEILKYCSSRW